MKILVFILLMLYVTSGDKDFYELTYTSLKGEEVRMETYRGKHILIVNTASECGLTPQYDELQKLYEGNNDRIVIIGFPSNDFGNQEPLDNPEIAAFCEENFGVTFPMAQKVSVKGDNKHPVYDWLTNKSLNGFEDSEVSWNFQKYLISPEGKLTHVFSPRVSPMDDEILNAISEN